MKDEIREGVEFLRQFLAKYGQLNQTQIDLFATKLTQLLEKRYVNHWYDDYPMKGQAFRCLRVKRSENYLDPVLDQILKELNLTISQLGLPNDFTLWIDPGEVNVRFGDQAGYTYSIARVNKNPDLSPSSIQDAKPSQEQNGASPPPPPSKPKSLLIVENSAKIFDEKLTAFIRQNSCNNPIPAAQRPAQAASEFDEDDFDKDISSADLIENLIKLSAEKRTISPPTSSLNSLSAKNPSVKRTNSSNININSSQLNNEFIPSGNNSNNNNSAQNNRLSYNDSCYYSSSSSSCSSSFGSNHDENLAQLGWLKQQQEQTSSLLLNRTNQCMPNVNTQSLFDNSNFSLDNSNIQNDFLFMPSFYTNNGSTDLLKQNSDSFGFYNQNQFGAFGNAKSDFDPASFDSFNKNTSNLFPINNSFGMNPNFMANLNSLNATNNGFLGGDYYKMGGSIYSETSSSSERSDTPSSCVTTASSLSCFTPNKSEPSTAAHSSADPKQQEEEEFNPASSSSSTTSTVSDSNQSKTNSSSNLNEMSTTPTKEKKSEDKQASAAAATAAKLSKSPSDTRKADSKSPNSEKKEDSYCGYVESFPYYYKLNRLYNALAVQKMQTERLKKAPIMNNPNVNSPASIAAAFANLATSSTATSIGQAQLRNLSKQPGSSPSNKFISMGSPSSSPSANQMSTLSTSPPPLSKQQQQQLGLQRSTTPLNLKLSPSAVNPNVIGSPSKNFQFNQQQSNSPSGLRQNANSPNGKNQNGYPMSPVNAAISFANHQTRANAASKTNNFQQRQNQQQQFKSNINSLPASFNGNMNQNNSSKLFDASLANLNSIGNNSNNNNNNSSFFPLFQQQQLAQQQQQQQQQQSPQSQQQQMFNNFYSKQMNWNRGQDMLKS